MSKHKYKYTFKEQVKWHLQGLLIMALGALVIGFIVLCAVMIVMP